MKARAIISSAILGPEALQAIRVAFDEAWSEISHHFEGDPRNVERARIRLAHAIIAVADDDSRDAQAIKGHALQVLALTMRELAGRS